MNGRSGFEHLGGEVSTWTDRTSIQAAIRNAIDLGARFSIMGTASSRQYEGRVLSWDEPQRCFLFFVRERERAESGNLRDLLYCFETTHDQGWMGFMAPRTVASEGGDTAIWRVPVPRSLISLQRRAYARTIVRGLPELNCHVPVTERGLGTSVLRARVLDISWGGISLQTYARGVALIGGARYPRCQLMVTPREPVELTLEVVRVSECLDPEGRPALRVSCKWVCPSGWALAQIQRCILRHRRAVEAPKAPAFGGSDDSDDRAAGGLDRQ